MKSIKTKIGLLTSGVAFLIAILLVAAFFVSFRSMVNGQIRQLDTTLREGFDRSIHWEVETANSLLLKIDALRKDGKLSEAQATDLAKTLLRDLR
ncbi:MAG TPA: hypothetical protein PKL75_06465 [Treponemataceae bacterium]|nr:hypothetical protein [Treponemataceae bacterium]